MDLCVVFGPLISFVVDFSKRIPFIARYPKLVAAALALLLNALPALGVDNANLMRILECLIVSFGGAVATHEVAKATPVLRNVKDILSGK